MKDQGIHSHFISRTLIACTLQFYTLQMELKLNTVHTDNVWNVPLWYFQLAILGQMHWSPRPPSFAGYSASWKFNNWKANNPKNGCLVFPCCVWPELGSLMYVKISQENVFLSGKLFLFLQVEVWFKDALIPISTLLMWWISTLLYLARPAW